MASLYAHRAENLRRTWLLFGVFVLLFALVGGLFAAVTESPALFVAALLFAVLSVLGSYWFADRIVLALARAKPIGKRDDPELFRLVENVSIAAGLPTPRVFLIDDPAPNAFAAGRDPAHAVVAVTRGLREQLERVELEGVLAHEMAHIGNRDVLVATVAAILAGVVVTLVDLFLRLGYGGGRRRAGHAGALAVGVLLVSAILAPLAATLLRLAVSRQREFLADASGALLTRYPDGLARALEKIAASPFRLRHAPDAVAHLWIATPKPPGEGLSWFTRLFLTHPPIPERVRRLRALSV